MHATYFMLQLWEMPAYMLQTAEVRSVLVEKEVEMFKLASEISQYPIPIRVHDEH